MSATAARALTFEQAQSLVLPDRVLSEALDRVASLDFSPIGRKLIEERDWTGERVEETEDLYRKFLALCVRYPDEKICPTGPVDDFWHAHILDTEAYARDCQFLFGKFLHHFPYFGMRGHEDRAALEAAFEASVDRFIRHYGIDPTAGDTTARSCRPQRCP